MWMVAPLVLFVLIFLLLHTSLLDWRTTLLKTSIVWSSIVFALTELLSWFGSLNVTWLAASYVTIIIGLLIGWWHKKTVSLKSFSLDLKHYSTLFKESKFFYYLLFTSGIIVFTFVTALVAATSNNDAMIYHMPRVMHWLTNQSINHYATHTDLQLMFGPWAEYIILHFRILAQSDRFVNLVQWSCFFGSIIAASVVSKELGGNKRIQFLSAVFVATIPMAILQASTTQNDLVVSYFLFVLSYFIIASIKAKHQSTNLAVYIGLSLGFVLLTKGTGYIFALPFMVWYGLDLITTKNVKIIVKSLALIMILITIINIGHALRNYALYGQVLGNPAVTNLVTTGVITGRSVLSNVIKDVASQLASPLPQFNAFLEKIVVPVTHKIIGFDSSDSRTTLGEKFDLYNQIWINEDFAGSFFHFGIISLFTIYFLVGWKSYDAQTRGYLLSVLCGFVLFAALIKWQLWINRLNLPFLVMGSVFIVVLKSNFDRLKYHLILFDLLFLTAFFPLFFNDSHPFIAALPYANYQSNQSFFITPREQQYFSNRGGYFQSYASIVDSLQQSGCNVVGLIQMPNEYALWAFIKLRNLPVRFQDIMVEGPSKKLERPVDGMCAVAVFTEAAAYQEAMTINYDGQSFTKVWEDDVVQYYQL